MTTGFVSPDFLNLGIGPFAPRGALAFAPRAALLPVSTVGTVFTKVRRNQSPQLVSIIRLPLSSATNGQAFSNASTPGQLPNPYTG
jgi:hypothetical protein